jgi:outer membrane protein TolC
VISAWAAGCRTPEPDGRLPASYRNPAPDAFVEESLPAAGAPVPVQSAIDLALRNNAQIQLLKQAAEVARAQARTCTDLQDPELAVTYGEGEEVTDRSWLVPRSEITPSISYPNDNSTLITSHPEDLNRDPLDTSKTRVLLEPGQEQYYLTRSSNTFHGTTADTESYRIAVRFFPPNPWRLSARGAGARANYAAALADLYNAEWSTRSEMKRLLEKIRYLKADLTLLEQLAETHRVSASMAVTLLDRQEMPVVDAMAASQRYIQTLNDRDRMERDLALAKGELLALSGQTVGDVDVMEGDAVRTNLAASALSAESLRDRALQNRRDIAAAYWRSQVATALLREAKASRVPWFTRLEASYGESRSTANQDAAWEMAGGTAELDSNYSISMDDQEQSEWRVEAIMSIPLFSAGPGATRVQKAVYKQTVAALGEATRLAMAQVDDALSTLGETETRSARLSAEITPRMDEARTLLTDLQQRPDVIPATIEKIKEVSIETERMLLKVRHERLLALIQLEQAVGSDLAELP